MKKAKAVWWVLLAAIAVGGGYVYLNRPQGHPPRTPPRTIRVAFDTWLGYSAFFIARDQGYYQKRGLNVELSVINPLQEKNAAMARGDIDVMGGSFDSAVISSNAGVPGAIVFVFEKSPGNDALLVGPGITKAKDLVGKRIAVEVGYVSHLFLLNYLDTEGVPLSDVQIVPLAPDDGVAAFTSGRVDAVALYEPFLSRAMTRPGTTQLVTSRGMDPLFCGTAYASKRLIDERPGDLKRFVQALQEANDYWRAHPAEGNRLVSAFWKLPAAEVKSISVNTILFTAADQRAFFGGQGQSGVLPKYVRHVADLWSSVGVVPKNYPTEPLVDARFVPNLDSDSKD